MASWAETLGFEGVATFMYAHSDEEREHMLKLVKFINERGGHAKVSHLNAPPAEFGSFKEMFQNLFEHEVKVSKSINDLVDITLQKKIMQLIISYNGMFLSKLKKKHLPEIF